MRVEIHADCALFFYGEQFSLFLYDRLAQKLHIKVVADRLHVAVLFRAEQVSGAADLHIAQGYLVTRAELGVLLDCGKPFFGYIGYALVPAVREIRVRASA